MTESTATVITAVCNADKTVTPNQLRAMLAIGRGEQGRPAPVEDLTPYTRDEAAARLRCCAATVTNYVRAGLIRRICGPTHDSTRTARGRGVRYCRADVDRIARAESAARHFAGRYPSRTHKKEPKE